MEIVFITICIAAFCGWVLYEIIRVAVKHGIMDAYHEIERKKGGNQYEK